MKNLVQLALAAMALAAVPAVVDAKPLRKFDPRFLQAAASSSNSTSQVPANPEDWTEETFEAMPGAAEVQQELESEKVTPQDVETLRYLPPLISLELHAGCEVLPEGLPVDFIYGKIEERFHFNHPEYSTIEVGEPLPGIPGDVNGGKARVVVNDDPDAADNGEYYTSIAVVNETRRERFRSLLRGGASSQPEEEQRRNLVINLCRKCDGVKNMRLRE